ncbi:MAG: AroM family protein, partial [Caldilineaceae bacterium]|nr:AroM family protein [Caldilineaceae bacterium]
MQQTGEARTGANRIMDKRIGLLTIGQSPRPDLVQTLPVLSPFAQVEAGALDGLAAAAIPLAAGAFPLTTRLADGGTVVVDEAFLLPRMQAAVHRLEEAGVAAILLMCAGTFGPVTSRVPLV